MTSSTSSPGTPEHDPLVNTLREIDSTPDETSPHLEATALAAWLDHALDEHERPPIEAHLAACVTCRALANEAREAVEDTAPAPVVSLPRSRTHRWLVWAAAAVFLVAVLGGLLMRGTTHDPPSSTIADSWATLGLQRGELPTHIETWIQQALQLNWPSVSGLAPFDAGTRDTALRGASTTGEPLLLGPRWSTVHNVRPEWTWLAPTPPSGETIRHEVLLLDADDRLVFEHAFETNATVIRMPFPADAPPLIPSRTYAWKVSTRNGDDWHASSFVPFRVLSAEESSQLNDDLDAAGLHEAARVVVLAHHGVLDQAVQILATAGGDFARPSPVRDQWTDTLLRQQRLTDDEVDRIREHLHLEDGFRP